MKHERKEQEKKELNQTKQEQEKKELNQTKQKENLAEQISHGLPEASKILTTQARSDKERKSPLLSPKSPQQVKAAPLTAGGAKQSMPPPRSPALSPSAQKPQRSVGGFGSFVASLQSSGAETLKNLSSESGKSNLLSSFTGQRSSDVMKSVVNFAQNGGDKPPKSPSDSKPAKVVNGTRPIEVASDGIPAKPNGQAAAASAAVSVIITSKKTDVEMNVPSKGDTPSATNTLKVGTSEINVLERTLKTDQASKAAAHKPTSTAPTQGAVSSAPTGPIKPLIAETAKVAKSEAVESDGSKVPEKTTANPEYAFEDEAAQNEEVASMRRSKIVKPPVVASDWSPVNELSPIMDVSPSLEEAAQEELLQITSSRKASIDSGGSMAKEEILIEMKKLPIALTASPKVRRENNKKSKEDGFDSDGSGDTEDADDEPEEVSGLDDEDEEADIDDAFARVLGKDSVISEKEDQPCNDGNNKVDYESKDSKSLSDSNSSTDTSSTNGKSPPDVAKDEVFLKTFGLSKLRRAEASDDISQLGIRLGMFLSEKGSKVEGAGLDVVNALKGTTTSATSATTTTTTVSEDGGKQKSDLILKPRTKSDAKSDTDDDVSYRRGSSLESLSNVSTEGKSEDNDEAYESEAASDFKDDERHLMRNGMRSSVSDQSDCSNGLRSSTSDQSDYGSSVGGATSPRNGAPKEFKHVAPTKSAASSRDTSSAEDLIPFSASAESFSSLERKLGGLTSSVEAFAESASEPSTTEAKISAAETAAEKTLLLSEFSKLEILTTIDGGIVKITSDASTKDSASLTAALTPSATHGGSGGDQSVGPPVFELREPKCISGDSVVSKEESKLILNTAQQMNLDGSIGGDDQSFVGMAKAITCCGTTDSTLRTIPSNLRKEEMLEIKTQPRGVQAVMSVSEQSDSQAPLLIKEKEVSANKSGLQYKKQNSLEDWSEKMEEPLGSLMEGMNKVSNRFKSAGGLFSGFGMSVSEEPKEKPKPLPSRKSPEADGKVMPQEVCLPTPKISAVVSPQEPKQPLAESKSSPLDTQKKALVKSTAQPGHVEEKLPPRPPPRSPVSSYLSLDSSQPTKLLLKHSESLGSSSSLSPTTPPSLPPPPLKYAPLTPKPPPSTPPTSPRRASQ